MMTLSATTGLRKTESANVVGMLPGSDPQLKNEYVVITAHLDHLGRGTAVNGDAVYNGAHDNAVGIGIMLEIARALHASNAKPRRSVIFAAVTAEEKGLLGSDFFARQAQTQEKKLVANINVDMPLTFAPVFDFVALGAPHSTLGTAAKQAVAAQGYRLSADAAPEQVEFIRSDQFSFIRRGIPALVVGSGYQPRKPERRSGRAAPTVSVHALSPAQRRFNVTDRLRDRRRPGPRRSAHRAERGERGAPRRAGRTVISLRRNFTRCSKIRPPDTNATQG